MDRDALGDLVCLHLAGVEDRPEGPAPWSMTAGGISEAIQGETETVTERVAVLSTLERLEASGHVERTVAPVAGVDGARNTYVPTDAGRERAAAARERLTEATVALADGEGREVPIPEAAALVEAGDGSTTSDLVRTAARAGDDGVVQVSPDDGDGHVGHDEQLAVLRTAVETTPRTGRTTVLVGGEAGIGKTPLLSRVTAAADREGYVTVETRCRRDGTPPFGPFERLFEVLADATGVASPFRETPPSAADPDAFAAQRRAFLDDVAARLREAATDRPVCLVVEDLQWADEATLELFVHLSETVTGWIFPVLLVGSYRPEAVVDDAAFADAVDALESVPRFEHVRLDPLSRAETAAFAARLADERLPDSLVDALQETTGGNPFFVRETVSHLLDADAVDAEDPGATLADLDTPDAVETAVERRLDALDDTGRDLLRVLGLAGDEMPRAVLAAAVDADPTHLREYVDILSASGTLETAGETVRFQSGLTGAAVRGVIEDTPALHRRIAHAFETVFDDPTVHHGTVAHHYERAGDYEAGVEARIAAAEAAEEVYANEVAIDEYERALSALPELPDDEADDYRVEILPDLAECHLRTGDVAAAERIWRRLYDTAATPAARVRGARGLFETRRKRGEFEAALSMATEGLAVDPPDGDRTAYDRERFRLVEATVWPHLRRGNVDRAREAVDRYREIAAALDPETVRPQMLDTLAGVELFDRNVEEAISYWKEAVDLLEGEPSRSLAASQSRLAVVYLQTGRYHDALELLDDAVRVERSRGDTVNRTIVEGNYAYALELLGRWDEARRRYDQCLDVADRLGLTRDAAFLRSRRGVLDVAQGDLDTGRQLIVRSLETALEIGHDRQEVMSRVALARLELLVGNFEACLTHAEAAVETAGRVDPQWEGSALSIAGDVHLIAGRPDEARAAYRAALETARACLLPRTEAAAESGIARVRAATGDPDGARDAAERAWTLATDLGEPLVIVRAGRTLARCLRNAGAYDRADGVLDSAADVAADVGATTFEASVLFARAALDETTGDRASADRRRDRARSLLDDRAFECVRDLIDRIE